MTRGSIPAAHTYLVIHGLPRPWRGLQHNRYSLRGGRAVLDRTCKRRRHSHRVYRRCPPKPNRTHPHTLAPTDVCTACPAHTASQSSRPPRPQREVRHGAPKFDCHRPDPPMDRTAIVQRQRHGGVEDVGQNAVRRITHHPASCCAAVAAVACRCAVRHAVPCAGTGTPGRSQASSKTIRAASRAPGRDFQFSR